MNAEAVHPEDEATNYLFDNWFDPIEAGLRERVRGFIETMLETELDAVLARRRYPKLPIDLLAPESEMMNLDTVEEGHADMRAACRIRFGLPQRLISQKVSARRIEADVVSMAAGTW
jgi:hypothetical protein